MGYALQYGIGFNQVIGIAYDSIWKTFAAQYMFFGYQRQAG